MKRLCIVWAVVLLLTTLPGCGAYMPVTVYDAQGGVLGTPDRLDFGTDSLTDAAYGDYVQLALTEAVIALAQAKDCSESRAERLLFSGGYAIHTALDPVTFSAVRSAYETAPEGLPFGCAITDLNGALCAVYSGGEASYALQPQSPHSAFKPLSVYAPALDAGLIHWGSRWRDEPYKQLKGENGLPINWPANATAQYSYEEESLRDSIRHSLNTVAVHCLHKYGVSRSLDFLEQSFDIDLTAERQRMEDADEDEIIGNIALGSLLVGVSPVDMAGYYQIFANYGMYTQPYTVTTIQDAAGTAVYTCAATARQVIDPTTGCIMNRLLQSVVQRGSTGEDAACENIRVAGKTGTDDLGTGNWFVGVTPQYSCAVWHGSNRDGNRAAALFASIVEGLPAHTQTDFADCAGVHKGTFCKETGLLFTRRCSKIETGYYATGPAPGVCDGH